METMNQGGPVCMMDCGALRFDVFSGFKVDGLGAVKEQAGLGLAGDGINNIDDDDSAMLSSMGHALAPSTANRVKQCFRRFLRRSSSGDIARRASFTSLSKVGVANEEEIKAALFSATSVKNHGSPGSKRAPLIVTWCIDKIELADDAELEGIYRRSGNFAVIRQLQAAFDKGEPPSGDMRADARSVADLLKRYVRSLPEPMLSKKRQNELIAAFDNQENTANQVAHFQTIFKKLSRRNAELCAIIFSHLGELSKREVATKMSTASLATVWAPNIFTAETPTTMLATAGVIEKHAAIVQLLIVNNATIFGIATPRNVSPRTRHHIKNFHRV